MKKSYLFITTPLCILAIGLLGLGTLSCSARSNIIVASKNFTENIILAELIGVSISEKTDLEVEVKPNFGSTFVVQQAIENGEIDIYPDYTGTLYQAKLKKTDRVSPEESYRIVKQEMLDQFNIMVFPSFGFNNTYAIGLLRSRAEELNLQKISDIRQHPYLIAGFDSEFIARADGGKAMFDEYGIELNNSIVSLEIGLRYQAVIEGQADFTDVFSTDSKLKRFDMLILEDDLAFFPPYYAVPVVRKEAVDKHPQLMSVLSLLQDILNEEEMINLNYEVEDNGRNPEEVAREFLQKKELL